MTPQIPREAQAQWDAGNKIAAIKLLREATGLGLAEAKALLEGPSRPVGVPTKQSSGALPSPVQSALARGNKIEAIRLLREAAGLGLKEAKDQVDAFAAKKSPASSAAGQGLAPGEVPRAGGGRMALLIVIGLAVLSYLVYRQIG